MRIPRNLSLAIAAIWFRICTIITGGKLASVVRIDENAVKNGTMLSRRSWMKVPFGARETKVGM